MYIKRLLWRKVQNLYINKMYIPKFSIIIEYTIKGGDATDVVASSLIRDFEFETWVWKNFC